MPQIDITANYERHRIRDPILFEKNSLRTLDIGKSGYHKLIRGKLKKTGQRKTQSVIIERKYAKIPSIEEETRKLIATAKEE